MLLARRKRTVHPSVDTLLLIETVALGVRAVESCERSTAGVFGPCHFNSVGGNSPSYLKLPSGLLTPPHLERGGDGDGKSPIQEFFSKAYPPEDAAPGHEGQWFRLERFYRDGRVADD